MRSSRRRYHDYKRELKEARRSGKGGPGGRSSRRHRSFGRLFLEFLSLLHGHRLTIVLALAALSVGTALKLIPLYGTKIVLDNVLAGHPLPPDWPTWLALPTDRRMLLTFVAVAMVVISCASIAINTWCRWQTTRVTKRVQVNIRRRLFDHAARLPLHRVYELKSGGVASILREDAGGIADLIFAMLYNPWRAIIQLLGSVAILAWVDWRLLLGASLVIPIVLVSHSTWVTRIRPLFRGVRASRQHVDSHATETFGGMRVVRGFSRQQTESGHFGGCAASRSPGRWSSRSRRPCCSGMAVCAFSMTWLKSKQAPSPSATLSPWAIWSCSWATWSHCSRPLKHSPKARRVCKTTLPAWIAFWT